MMVKKELTNDNAAYASMFSRKGVLRKSVLCFMLVCMGLLHYQQLLQKQQQHPSKQTAIGDIADATDMTAFRGVANVDAALVDANQPTLLPVP